MASYDVAYYFYFVSLWMKRAERDTVQAKYNTS